MPVTRTKRVGGLGRPVSGESKRKDAGLGLRAIRARMESADREELIPVDDGAGEGRALVGKRRELVPGVGPRAVQLGVGEDANHVPG